VNNFAKVPEGGIFTIIKTRTGEYLAILPLASEQAYGWMQQASNGLGVRLGTQGRGVIAGDIPLFAWARSRSAYGAAYAAWKVGLDASRQPVKMRQKKVYPEPFEYLGWCSWMAYGPKLSEQNMVEAIREIESSEVPIRYFLMDEGHANRQSLKPDSSTFPHGYKPLTKYRNPEKIRWFGLWLAFLGDAHGVPPPGDLGQLRSSMMQTANGVLIPKPDEESATAFYEFLIGQAGNGEFDFIKVDFMVDALPLYAGVQEKIPTLGGLPPNTNHATDNPYADSVLLVQALQRLAAEKVHGVMNCNWHNAACLFNSGGSAIGRCSEDYQSNHIESAKAHIYHAFSAIPWLGQTAWGDHDMFDSGDHVAAQTMAISKAISGGPIYLSDAPKNFVKSVIEPFCYKDGRLLRPLAPATSVEEDLFYAPGNGKLYRVVAPLPNDCVAVVVFHLESNKNVQPLKLGTSISADHYRQASAMMQPYASTWKDPEEGLVVYDWSRKMAVRLAQSYEVSLENFGGLLLQLSPIRSGWSVIGRIDKYLPGAAIDAIAVAPGSLAFTLKESGPFAIWCEHGVPISAGISFKAVAENFYIADFHPGVWDQHIEIHI
jgi:hypothetical protein